MAAKGFFALGRQQVDFLDLAPRKRGKCLWKVVAEILGVSRVWESLPAKVGKPALEYEIKEEDGKRVDEEGKYIARYVLEVDSFVGVHTLLDIGASPTDQLHLFFFCLVDAVCR